MARFTGYRCDVCDKSGEPSDKNGLPTGWMQVILPDTPDNVRPEDRSRDICSGKCLSDFGKERGEVDGSLRPRQPRSQMDPGLKKFLTDNGVEGRLMGQKLSAHSKHSSDNPNQECLVCTYYFAGVAG